MSILLGIDRILAGGQTQKQAIDDLRYDKRRRIVKRNKLRHQKRDAPHERFTAIRLVGNYK